MHGDTVCASIDLREHPAVRPLTKEHLAEATAAFATAASATTPSPTGAQSGGEHHQHGVAPTMVSSFEDGAGMPNNDGGRCGDSSGVTLKPRKVILAPFGMAATLTGNSYKSSDPMAEKVLEDWASFFPLCNKENSDIPPVVEVVSGMYELKIIFKIYVRNFIVL